MNCTQDEIDQMFNEALSTTKQKKTDDEEKDINKCRICKSYTLLSDFSNGIVVCTSCGSISENQMIDESAEWNFGADEAASGGKDPARCGMPVNEFFQKSGCSTVIGGNPRKNYLMKKLHAQMSMDYVERSRYHMFVKISKMCDSLPNTILDTVKWYFVRMSEEKLSRGNVRKGLIACCIFYACKKHNVARSIKEVSVMCEIEPSVFNNSHKIFCEIMKKHISPELFEETTQVDDLTSRFCGYLDFNRQERMFISKNVNKMNSIIDETQILIGKTPSAITASCIYYVIQEKDKTINKKYISERLNVSIVTINKIYTTLKSNSHLFD